MLNPSDGTTLNGTVEPGTTVTLTDGSSDPIGQVIANGSDSWSFTPGTPLINGAVVNVMVSDPTDNTSVPVSIIVNPVAPVAPMASPSNGTEISGIAEPGVMVTPIDGGGNLIG